MVRVIIKDRKGLNPLTIEVAAGTRLLEAAQGAGVDMEGACEGHMACSTCHVVVDKDWFKKLPRPSIEEDELLELAPGLMATSRLACQIRIEAEYDGLEVSLPSSTRCLHR